MLDIHSQSISCRTLIRGEGFNIRGKKVVVPHGERGSLMERKSLTINNNQQEAMLLQDVIDFTEFKLPNFKRKEKCFTKIIIHI